MSANEIQIGGTHYKELSVQPWDAMRAWMTRPEFMGFLRGNAIKYLARAGAKDAKLQDLKKARHYLDKLIEEMEGDGVAMECPAPEPAATAPAMTWQEAKDKVHAVWPHACCLPWNGRYSVWAKDNPPRQELGCGRAAWDAWMDAADRLLKGQGA